MTQNSHNSKTSNSCGNPVIFSAANNGDPIPIPLPNTLDLLFAQTHVSLACYVLPGGLIGYLQATLFFFWVLRSFIVCGRAWNFVEYMGQNVALKQPCLREHFFKFQFKSMQRGDAIKCRVRFQTSSGEEG
jgi:hypothetical protein